MPSIEPQNNIEEQNNEGEPEQKPPTLTDHLNKKLLSSFLTRINSEDSNFTQMFKNDENSSNGTNEADFSS